MTMGYICVRTIRVCTPSSSVTKKTTFSAASIQSRSVAMINEFHRARVWESNYSNWWFPQSNE